MKTLVAALILSLAGASGAAAQSPAVAGPMPVTGNVPALCSAGTISGGDSVFGLGVLINTSTGLLRDDLSAPPKILSGSFCNLQSTITITATPMLAESSVGTPPPGFTNAVNFTASASGWTPVAAQTTTGAASNPAASQSRATPFSGDISVAVSAFTAAGGPSLRLMSDPSYRGTVTVTLAGAS